MISRKAATGNSKLINFQGTKELVIRNAVPKTSMCFNRNADCSSQSNLFQF